MQNNKIMTIILGVALFFILFGTLFCSRPDGSSEYDILVWVSYGPEEYKMFEKIANDWSNQKDNKYKIHIAQIPWMGQESKYRTAIIAGAPPDIGRIDTPFLPELVYNNALTDITDLVLEEEQEKKLQTGEIILEYVKAAIESCIIKDKNGVNRIYGFPDQTNGACLFYNKDLFKANGLDPEKPPKTWDEFVEYAQKLTNHEKEVYGFGMDNSLWWTFPFFNTFGAEFLSEDGKKCLLNSENAIKALQFKVDLYRKYKVEGGAWKSGGQNTETGFINGRYAMILMGPWNVSRFKASKLNFGVALIPEGPAGTSTNVGGTNMVIFKNDKRSRTKLKACYNFLRYLTSADVQAMWASTLKQIPVNLKAYDKISLSDKEDEKILKTFMEQMKTAKARPKVLKYSQLETIINPEMEAALSGNITVEQALNIAVNKIEKEVLIH